MIYLCNNDEVNKLGNLFATADNSESLQLLSQNTHIMIFKNWKNYTGALYGDREYTQ